MDDVAVVVVCCFLCYVMLLSLFDDEISAFGDESHVICNHMFENFVFEIEN